MSSDFAAQLVAAKLRLDEATEAQKAAAKEYEEISSALAEYWEGEKVHSQKIVYGGQKYTVYRTHSLQASVPARHREQLVNTCREMGLEHLVETTVGTQRIKSYILEQMGSRDDSQGYDFDAIPAEIRPLLSLFDKKKTAVRKG